MEDNTSVRKRIEQDKLLYGQGYARRNPYDGSLTRITVGVKFLPGFKNE